MREAVDWTIDRLDLFEIAFESDAGIQAGLQRLCELLVAAHCLKCHQGAAFEAEIARIAAFGRERADDGRLHARLATCPEEFTLHVMIHAMVSALDRRDPATSDRLQACIDAGVLRAVERVPHRALDIRLAVEWAGLRHDLPSFAHMVEDSIVATPAGAISPVVLFPTASGLYAFTHVLIFCLGFGIREHHRPADADAVADTLAQLAILALRDHDWDLLAEIILCFDALTYAAAHEIVAGAVDELLRRQLGTGAFPGPRNARRREDVFGPSAATLDKDTRRRAEFRYCYHTTLVCIVMLSNRRARLRPSGTL